MGIQYLKKAVKTASTDDTKTRDIVQKLLSELEKSEPALKDLTFQEKKEFYKAAAIEQRRLLFQEPWLLRKFNPEKRMEILAEYTPEQQENMKARMDLEDDFRREKRKGFG